MKHLLAGLLILAGACSPVAETPEAPSPEAATPEVAPAVSAPPVVLPAGDYRLDKSHASVTFTVNHLGFSTYTAGFDDIDASLKLDPANPAAASLTATIKPASLDLPSPPEGFLKDMLGPTWFDAAAFPDVTFRSTAIVLTGPETADVTGDLTIKGITKPVTLAVVFNGGWEGIPPEPFARAGFSAKGALKRSDFGMLFGIPQPGTETGVSDEVAFDIETEFRGPAWNPPAEPAPEPAPAQ
jgi:polyisoprenoid-binding protein YceI